MKSMKLICDDDVKAVAEFMQNSMPAAKLVSVASAVASLAPILWGQFEAESISALRLAALPPNVARGEAMYLARPLAIDAPADGP